MNGFAKAGKTTILLGFVPGKKARLGFAPGSLPHYAKVIVVR
jgi:hypothetical protein